MSQIEINKHLFEWVIKLLFLSCSLLRHQGEIKHIQGNKACSKECKWPNVKTCQNKACMFREKGHNHTSWKMETSSNLAYRAHLLCHLEQGYWYSTIS